MVNVAVGSIRQLRIDFGFSSMKVIATMTNVNAPKKNAPKRRGMQEEKVATDAAELDRYGDKSLFYSCRFHFLLLLALLLLSLVITSLPSLKFYSDAQISLLLFVTVVLGIQGRGFLGL